METEIWKSIIGYEGLYEVSNHGNVRSVERLIIYSKNRGTHLHKSKNRKKSINGVGYYQVDLSKEGKRKCICVHRCVAEVFCEKINGKNVINHIDGNYLNNYYLNLEWVTPKENYWHAVIGGSINKYGENHFASKLTNKDANDIRLLKSEGMKMKEIAKIYSVSEQIVNRICRNASYVGMKKNQKYKY